MNPMLDTPIPMLPPYRITSTVSILAETADYNHQMMNIPAVWKNTRGAPVKVAILDTGLPEHIDLKPQGSASFVPGYLIDKNGHSTHVGGIIAAVANNDMGVAGVAPEADDYYGAVLGADGSGTINGIVKGIYWAVDVVGAQVINMSLGIDASVSRIKELEKACNYAASKGTIIVAAAGNEAGPVGQPAVYDSVIAVAAVDINKKHAWFSNVGPQVDFAAGGVKVYSTWLKNGYAKLDGTSMAAPVITGVVALIQADYFNKHQRYMTFQEVYAALKKIAFDVGPDGFDDEFGYGIPVFQYDQVPVDPGSGSETPPVDEPSSGQPPVTPPDDQQPKKWPCDCSLAFPLVGEFLNGAGAAAEAGSNADEMLRRGVLAARDYWARVDNLRARVTTRHAARRLGR
jgi:subtilisin family serine protease